MLDKLPLRKVPVRCSRAAASPPARSSPFARQGRRLTGYLHPLLNPFVQGIHRRRIVSGSRALSVDPMIALRAE